MVAVKPEPKRILHVEDEPSWRSIVSEILEAEGFRVTGAESQERALKLLSENQYDLLILDLSLVPIDAHNTEGMQILELLNQHSSSKTAGVIILTAYATKDILRKVDMQYGVGDVVDKFDLDKGEFIKIVKATLPGRPHGVY